MDAAVGLLEVAKGVGVGGGGGDARACMCACTRGYMRTCTHARTHVHAHTRSLTQQGIALLAADRVFDWRTRCW